MSTKRYISAGAGSGKTYTITTEVAKSVKEGTLRPDQVIMTTFTKAAAQELREKAKKELINLDLFKEAQQMEHALIGTVHSVANTFITKYWYLLGIMPDVCALEDDELEIFRNQSLRGLLNDDNRKFLYAYCEKYQISYSYNDNKSGLNYSFWKDDLCKVLDYIQWYNISDDQLDKSLNETTESIIKLLEPKSDISHPPVPLRDILSAALEAVNGARKSQKKTNQLEFLTKVNLEQLSYDSIDSFSKILTDRKIDTEESRSFQSWATEITTFRKETVDDHRRYAKTIFCLAKKWRTEYRHFKDEHHLIDFNDMETMFLDLLTMEEVQEDIKSRYSCIYVDEFQDSNPMQVCIFQKLSELVDSCYVGDKKQAIYGFRGADTELTASVADSIRDIIPLPHSHRSIKPLVDLSNTIFKRVFEGQSNISLTVPDDINKGNRDTEKKPMRLWQWDNEQDLALQIQQLILREKISEKDIAVLARTNDKLDELANELRSIGISVCREENDLISTRTGLLLKALLTLMAAPGNMLARAEVAYLTQDGYDLTHIIEERLDNLSDKKLKNNDYLKDLPFISRFETLRKEIKNQSISALVESIIIEMNLYSLVSRWKDAEAERTNLQVFVDLAKKYEADSTKLGNAATVAGFIDFFCNRKQTSAADDTGVRLFTYHKAKGLEWKVVIMLSLDQNLDDTSDFAKKCFLGCHNHREEKPTEKNPNPPMTISIVRNVYARASREKLSPAIVERLQAHPFWDNEVEAERGELSRLLYVGVTRARNVLILASKRKKEEGNIDLSWFRTAGIKTIKNTLTEEPEQDILGIGIPFAIEKLDMNNLLGMVKPESDKTFNIAADFSSLENERNLSPSKAGKTVHELGKILNDREKRIPESLKEEDYAAFGDFIHQVFCRMDDGIDASQIIELRNSYGFSDKEMHKPKLLQDAWNFLIENLNSTYGPSINRIHELPFRHLDNDRKLVNGYMDLIWETEDAYVIVDYKTCASNYKLIFDPDSEHFAGRHGDQLDCYQRALEAAGDKRVKARLIFYPMTGYLMEVE